MKVSIITVCFNADDTIEQTIRSVFAQTYKDIEYIVVDGMSTDITLDIVNKYKHMIAHIISEKDSGIYDAMNKGIKIASGDIIGILNADDWYESDAVENVVRCFEQSDAEIVHGDVNYIWASGKTQRSVYENNNSLWHSMVVKHPAAFVRKEIYEKFGVFDTSYRIAGDYEFVLRCYSNGVRLHYLNKILTNFRMSGISNVQNALCTKETDDIALRYITKSPNEKEVHNAIRLRDKRTSFISIIEDDSCDITKSLGHLGICPDSKIVIWGSGVWGERIVKKLLSQKIYVEYIVDTDCEKIGTIIQEIEVKEPDQISKEHIVIVAVSKPDNYLLTKIEKYRNENIRIVTFKELEEQVLADRIENEKE